MSGHNSQCFVLVVSEHFAFLFFSKPKTDQTIMLPRRNFQRLVCCPLKYKITDGKSNIQQLFKNELVQDQDLLFAILLHSLCLDFDPLKHGDHMIVKTLKCWSSLSIIANKRMISNRFCSTANKHRSYMSAQ